MRNQRGVDTSTVPNVPITFHKYKTVEQGNGIRIPNDQWYTNYGNFCNRYRNASELGKAILKAKYV